mgnify:FL=1
MAVTVTVEAIGHVAMTDHLENPVVRGQVLASHLHRLPPATVDAERKSLPAQVLLPGRVLLPAQVLLPVRGLLHVRFHRHLRHVLPMTTDAAVPADVFSLRHSRPLSCQSVNLKMQSHRQMTVTCILYAKLQASFFHMVNNRIGQAAISG